tara:strand:+ start:52 stop:492 length:441 start_codon:yes stop_codon:yes gene_type:complete
MKRQNNNIAIVISEFNYKVTEALLDGAQRAFDDRSTGKLKIIKVPGAFEIPATVKKVASTLSVDAVVTLGAIIKGETRHFDFISSECTRAIQQLTLDFNIPIIFGVLTTENTKQALDRATKKDKGYEVMTSAFHMINTFKEIEQSS